MTRFAQGFAVGLLFAATAAQPMDLPALVRKLGTGQLGVVGSIPMAGTRNAPAEIARVEIDANGISSPAMRFTTEAGADVLTVERDGTLTFNAGATVDFSTMVQTVGPLRGYVLVRVNGEPMYMPVFLPRSECGSLWRVSPAGNPCEGTR